MSNPFNVGDVVRVKAGSTLGLTSRSYFGVNDQMEIIHYCGEQGDITSITGEMCEAFTFSWHYEDLELVKSTGESSDEENIRLQSKDFVWITSLKDTRKRFKLDKEGKMENHYKRREAYPISQMCGISATLRLGNSTYSFSIKDLQLAYRPK